MDWRFFVWISCLLMLPFCQALYDCPGGPNEKFCPERDGCVGSGQNCSDGEILSCVNATAMCNQNETIHCVDVLNYTCGNFSCDNYTRYCPESKSCIKPNESCCTDREEACVEVGQYANLLKPGEAFDMICHLVASPAGLSSNYSEIKRKNLVEKELCDNGTYFCPHVLDCISMNISCNISLIQEEMDDSFDVFDSECAKHNKSFCSLVMHCIPRGEACSYKKLFDWYEVGNMSVDPFGEPCAANQTFCPLTFNCSESCPLTFNCSESCDLDDIKGNKSCNDTPGSSMPCFETLQCVRNETECKPRLDKGNYTNVTDSTDSGWLDVCKHRKLISHTFWMKSRECKPLADRCKGKGEERKTCDFHPRELCEKLRYLNKTDHPDGNVTVWIEGCRIMVDNTTLKACRNKSCAIHELCRPLHEVLEDHKDDDEPMLNRTIRVAHCNITFNATVMDICNISLPNKSCAIHELCRPLHEVLEDHKDDDEPMLNRTIRVAHCNITFNATVMDICNISLPEKRNKSCAIHELCRPLHEVLEDHKDDDEPMLNRTIRVAHCNITFNATVMDICNISLPEKRNKSCAIHELCRPLHEVLEDHKDDDEPMLNRTIRVAHCNITFNATVMDICNISLPEKRNKSCAIHELCRPLHEVLEDHKDDDESMLNRTIRVAHCNITFNATVMDICNISLPEKRNKSCAIHELCRPLHEVLEDHKDDDEPMPLNRTIRVAHCNITFNATVMDICNITLPEKRNKSCAIHELCRPLHEVLEDHKDDDEPMLNRTIRVAHCNITFNATVMDICNISLPEKRNKSCAIHELCRPLHEVLEDHKDDDEPMLNRTIRVAHCNITFNATVMDICNISLPEKWNRSCAIHELCRPLHEVLEDHKDDDEPMLNRTIRVAHCNITFNATVMDICNISLPRPKNRSCEIHKLCHDLREKMDDDDESMMNRTIHVGGCNITMNATVMEMCNISKISCKIEKLCHQLRNFTGRYTKYDLPYRPVRVGKCNVTLNATELENECNITLTELSEYHFKSFFNGFQISDSVEKNVGFIAVYELGLGNEAGTWKYKKGLGAWTPLGSVSPKSALVLASEIHLSFVPNDPFWHGLAILKYSIASAQSGGTGSHIDVSFMPEDPRNNLALVQVPPRPVANVTAFIGGKYTVPEDEETAGFKITERLAMNLSYHVVHNIPAYYFKHLDDKVVKDYNMTVRSLESCVPAIAIIYAGNPNKGKWKIGDRSLSSVSVRKPAVVTPDDYLSFVSAEHIYGNWTMKFIPVVYFNKSMPFPKEYFDAPAPIANAMKWVMVSKNISKGVEDFVESVMEEMASSQTSYSLENFNGVVDRLPGSSQNKTKAKDIAAMAFDRVTLPPPPPYQLDGLPRVLSPHGKLTILNNQHVFLFDVHVTPTNDQPIVHKAQTFLPAIAYNVSTNPNVGILVKDLVKKPLASDIDGDVLGIAVVQALNTSVGSWYWKSPSGGWVQMIVDNDDYTDNVKGEVEAFLLKYNYTIRFQMHQDDILWSNLEAQTMAKFAYLAWDGSGRRAVESRTNVTRPSEDTSAYSEKSVMAIVRRIGCDGRMGSEGKNDRCGVCGGDGNSCMGCDKVLNSGAIIDHCGNCTGGTTGVTFDVMKDCAKECGLSFTGTCDVCQRKDSVKNFTDCTGACFGGAKINKCKYCTGGSSGKTAKHGEDTCGICGGDSSTCRDCSGVPNGGKVVDFCANCLLPSDSRFNNECVKLKLNVPESGPSTGDILVEVQGAGLKTYSTVACDLVKHGSNAKTATRGAAFKNFKGARVIRFSTPPLSAGKYDILCKFGSGDTSYEVENTNFLVYNKTTITYSSASPDETSVESAIVSHITGTGFVNTTDLACVSQEGHLFEATFLSATNVSCSIPASKESARLKLALSFSRADRSVDAVKNVNFTIFAEAVNVTSAMFLDNLQGIVVSFDDPTAKIVKSKNCYAFFQGVDVAKFGSRSLCLFRRPTKFIIVLRGRPTIAPGDTIQIKMTSFEQKFQDVTKPPAVQMKSMTILSPRNPVVPEAVLTGSSFLGLCATLKLDGGQSYGAGGRRLSFNWTVEWEDPDDSKIDANATADLVSIKSYLSSLSNFTWRIERKAPAIVVGPAYKFSLQVRNFLSETSEKTSVVVQRENKQLPGLRLGAEKKRMKAALGTILEGKVQLSSCLPPGYKPKVIFSWEIQAVGIDLGVVNQPRLRIAPRALLGGKTYKLTCTATMESDVSLSTTIEISLEVVSSPLQAIIKGGNNLVVGEDDTFVLDASPSSDPDGASDVASYEWQCFDSANDPCFEPDPINAQKQKRMVIPSTRKASINVPSKLKTNSNYSFVLIFRKGSRKSETTITAQVKSGAPPRVLIRPLSSLKVNPTKPLIVGSLVKSKKSVNISWSCVEEEGYGFINLENPGVLLTPRTKSIFKKANKPEVVTSLDLVIDKDKLSGGVKFMFRLTAEHEDSSSYSDIIITTNAAPSQGSLEVTPASGFFGNTSFTFSAAEGWSDAAEDLPLSYQFGYYVRDAKSGQMRKELLGTPIYGPALEVDLLPQGEESNNYTLTVFVVVADIYGAVAREEAQVVVRPVVLDASAVSQFAAAVDSDFESGDLAKGTAKANAVVGALAGSGPADANTTKALQDFKSGVTDKVLSASESGGVQDESGKDVVKGSLLQMTSGCKPNCNPSRVASNLAAMEGGAAESSPAKRKRRAVQEADIQVKTGDQVTTVLQIFENVIDGDDYGNSSIQAKSSLLSTIKAQEKSLCKGLATGGPEEIAKSNVTVIRAVKNTFASVDSDFLEVSSSTSPEYIEATVVYRLGQSLKTQYESWSCTADDTCTGTCIATAQFKDDLLIQHDPSDKNLTRLSDVASVRLYNPETLAEISVSGLASPVALRFPIENAESYENYTKECRVWNAGAKEWQLSGCTGYTTINTSVIECSCTQLGYITVFKGEKGSPTPLPTTPAATKPTKQPEQAVKVEFAFAVDYNTTVSGNITKAIFIDHLRSFLASVLNISKSRISDMDIRSGSIIVTFSILPGNNSDQVTVNSTVLRLQQLVESNDVNFTLPGTGQTIRVDPTSFQVVGPTVAPTTVEPSDDDDDDDGLSTTHIVIIAVVCSLVFLAVLAALLYYCLRVQPARVGKISPKGSQLQLQDQSHNQSARGDGGANNNAIDVETDEKSV